MATNNKKNGVPRVCGPDGASFVGVALRREDILATQLDDPSQAKIKVVWGPTQGGLQYQTLTPTPQPGTYFPPTDWPAAGTALRIPRMVRFFLDTATSVAGPAYEAAVTGVQNALSDKKALYVEFGGGIDPAAISFADATKQPNGNADINEPPPWAFPLPCVVPPAAVTTFFGTRVINLVVLSYGYMCTTHAASGSPTWPMPGYSDMIARMKATYPLFAGYETHWYIDSAVLGDTLLLPGDVATLAGNLADLCGALGDYGHVYGGTLDYHTVSAATFLPTINSFFGF